MNLYLPGVENSKLCIVFLFFSLVGWICEVAYVGIFFEHKFVNRGFLFGPVCPVYGCGGILILSLPAEFQSPLLKLFLVGLLLCSIVEYLVSVVLERMFHTKWWDYSNKKISVHGHNIRLNINGRVCLQNSILFGILTVVVIRFVQPLIWKAMLLVDDLYLQIIAAVLAVAFVIDVIISVHKLVDFSVYMARIKEFSDSLRERYQHEIWFRSGSISEMFESIKEHAAVEKEKFSNALIEKIERADRHHPAESYLHRFPTMKSAAYKDSIALFRHHMKDSLAEKKAAFDAKRKAGK